MIHKYSQNGFYIVLDVYSGAVHAVDKLTYRLLDLIAPPLAEKPEEAVIKTMEQEGFETADILAAYQEVCELYQNDQLFSSDQYAQYADRMVSSPIKAMCLHIAHDCNLRCKYCFASTGNFGEGRKLMPVEIGKKAIDFLIARSYGRKNLELDFFGGEPLMNFDAVKEIVVYARGLEKEHNKNFRFTITTNGLLLDDDKIDFINREMSNVVLSIDGRQEINDSLRSRVDGSGSYGAIVPKYQRLVEKRGHENYYVRGTFTKHNLDFTEDVMHLYDLGFDQISVEPVVSDPNFDYSIGEEDLPRIFEEYDKLSKQILKMKKEKMGINFFHFMLDLDQGPCAIKRLRGCGCGNEYVAVTPDGDIYPCHQFVGNQEWKMGSVLDNSLDLQRKDDFARATVYDKKNCMDCWAKFYCSGGCNANNMQYEGDIRKPHQISCDLEKKRLECAIMIKVAQSLEE